MKTWPSIKLLLYFFCVTHLFSSEIPYLLEVKKDTPLFSKPSTSSSRLAEAEEGTLLLYRGRSKRRIWVKLSDSEGLEGWMPMDRTDYKEVESARVSLDEIQKISSSEGRLKSERQKTKEEMMEEILQSKNEKPFDPFLRIAPLTRWLSDSEPTSSRIGFRIDYNLGKTSLSGNGALSPAWFSGEATFPSPFVSHSGSDFTGALRYVWRAPLWGPFVYGPDLGYSVDSVASQYRHHFSLGMAAAVVLGPIDLMLRTGYDFFSRSRAMIEVQVGVSF